MDLLQEYFISPIFDRTGYNAINTLVYASIALVCLYVLWRLMRRIKFDFASRGFLYGVAAFVLFGSTARVLTDLSDAGTIATAAGKGGALGAIYSWINASGLFSYGYLTVTPGIYVVTAVLFLAALLISLRMKNEMFAAYAGFVLWLPCFLLLLPFAANIGFAALAIAIAALGSFIAYYALQFICKRPLELHEKLAIFGQALDGASTFVVINIFSAYSGKGYFEQHVLSSAIGTSTPLGFFLFFLIKIALASAIVYFLSNEKIGKKDIAFILIIVAVMGFAPGLRDMLRMLAGT
jgi:uncharacterized membrane protein